MPTPKTFQEAEFIYERATKLEFAAEFNSAFRLYIDASEAFLQLSRSAAATPAFQARCRENASKAIQRAEKIQKANKLVSAPTDPFGADYQAYVLRKSSTVNDVRYPLWSEPVPPPSNPGPRYSDPDGQPSVPLSIPTTPTTVTWQRTPFTPQELSLTLTPADIEQNIVNDCSVCASVAVCVQHNQRFDSRLLSSSLLSGNQPGRHDIKVYLNGDYRRICKPIYLLPGVGFDVSISASLNHLWSHPYLFLTWSMLQAIDDLLPYDNIGRPIGISSGRNKITWPAFIEKAYMKLMGGYDFPGSNSSIDLRVLTGWIPEHIELQSALFERERTWERIANGFRKGHCVLTVGTDAKTTLKIRGVKLLPSHDYAVVDVRETNGERWLTLIDSRVPAVSPSTHHEHENGSDLNDPRMLDMRWDNICATFEGMYASWNPGLFQNGTKFHGIWKPVNADDQAQASVRHLRLLYECQNTSAGGGGPLDTRRNIWVLLTRHLSQTHREAEYISLTVDPEDADDRGDIWVKTRDTEVKGPYTTSPHVLVRIKVGKELSHASLPQRSTPTKVTGAFSVLASYDGSYDDVFFTLNVFCDVDIKVWWDEVVGTGNSSPGGSGFSVKVDGAFTTKSAGGNHTHPTYMLNPQWHLRIYDDDTGSSRRFASNGKPSFLKGLMGNSKLAGRNVKTGQKSVVALSAQGPREVPLNVTAVWSSGERTTELTQKEVVTSSGAYTYGRARAVADMAPGDYTVILSAFEPEIHLGQFTLKVESSRQLDLVAIPQEGAGMYTRVSRGEWDEHTAVGGPSHGRYRLNPIYEVQLLSSAQLGARLHLTSSAPTAALNLALFPASGARTLDLPIASSGPYSDALSGVYIPPRMLSLGKYWIVPSTFVPGVRASFRLVVYCSDSGCVVSRRS